MTKQENEKWVEFEAQSGSGYERIHVTYYKQEQRFFVSGTHDGHMGMPCVEFSLSDLGIHQ